MTAETEINLKAGRRRVARSRGALSGILLIIFGAWAALIPFIGPYFNLAYKPKPDDAWHWTAGRGWLEVLPGAAAVLGGLLLLLSSSRAMTLLGGWLGAVGGAWLVIGPSMSAVLNLEPGAPESSKEGLRALEELLFFFAIGAAILFVASLALGRLSVHSVRDVRAAERRAEAEAAEQQRLEHERRVAAEQSLAEERWAEQRRADEQRHAGATGEMTDRRDDEGDRPGGGVPTQGGDAHGARGDHATDQRSGATGSPSYPGHRAGEHPDGPAGQAPNGPQSPPSDAPGPGQQAPGYPPPQAAPPPPPPPA